MTRTHLNNIHDIWFGVHEIATHLLLTKRLPLLCLFVIFTSSSSSSLLWPKSLESGFSSFFSIYYKWFHWIFPYNASIKKNLWIKIIKCFKLVERFELWSKKWRKLLVIKNPSTNSICALFKYQKCTGSISLWNCWAFVGQAEIFHLDLNRAFGH